MQLSEIPDLIDLPGGSKGVRRQITPKATIPDDANGEPIIDFRSSDETLDRYGEIVVATGWDLTNYKKNPVVQNAHNYWSITDTLGKSIITEIRGTELFQRVKFAVEENPLAKIAYGLYRGGFLNAVSVGFIPKRWENGSDKAGYRRKYLEQELLEVSAVGIPANPNALALGLKSGAIERKDLNEAYKLLKHLASHRIDPGEIKFVNVNQTKLLCPHCNEEITEKGLQWIPEPGMKSGHFIHQGDCGGKLRFAQPDDAAFKKFLANQEGTEPDSSAKGFGADLAQLASEARALSDVLKRS